MSAVGGTRPAPGTGTGRRLVVEADGGSRGNPGLAGYGALVRDADSGDVLVEVGEAIGRATNNVAEYRGLLAGLRAAAEVDPAATVEVRMDSKLVVEQMSGRWKIKHADMRDLALQAGQVLPREQVRYTWVPRERNSAADALANAAMDGERVGSRAAGGGREANAHDGGGMLPGMAETSSTVADPASGQGPGRGAGDDRLAYRLLTGADDRAFCEKVSRALADGYVLHGPPALTHDGDRVVAAQAVVLPARGTA